MVEARGVMTSHGPVILWGRFAPDPRPPALIIRGAFAEKDIYARLPDDLPGFNVFLTHLPGMHTPFLPVSSVQSFAAAYDEAFAQPVHALGFSVGGLVAMAMRNTASVVAVDPPLQTAPLWPLRGFLDNVAENASEDMKAWVRGLFGITENRDYRPLVKPDHHVIIAGEPLEPERDPIPCPGLITREDREWLRSVCRTTTVPTGHNVPSTPEGRRAVIAAMQSVYAEP